MKGALTSRVLMRGLGPVHWGPYKGPYRTHFRIIQVPGGVSWPSVQLMISAQKSREIEPHPGLRLDMDPGLDSLPRSLSAPPTSALSLQRERIIPQRMGRQRI